MNPLFPNANKIYLPKVLEYDCDPEMWQPTDEKIYYQEILGKIFGEQEGYELKIVDIYTNSKFLVIEVID